VIGRMLSFWSPRVNAPAHDFASCGCMCACINTYFPILRSPWHSMELSAVGRLHWRDTRATLSPNAARAVGSLGALIGSQRLKGRSHSPLHPAMRTPSHPLYTPASIKSEICTDARAKSVSARARLCR
jgi:hypothetical protein